VRILPGYDEQIAKINERIQREIKKAVQLENKKSSREAREKATQRKDDTRLKIIIGADVLAYFPEMRRFKPRKNNAENRAEFAEFAAMLSILAADKEYVAALQEKARARVAVRTAEEN